MKVFIVLTIVVAIATAHHTEKHVEDTKDTGSDLPDLPEEEEDTSDPTNILQSRHHIAPSTLEQSRTVPVLIPYPAFRSQAAYPTQQIQYVPVYQYPAYPEYPKAGRTLGGGLNANLGPINGGIGAGIGAGGAGGGLNLGFGSFGGLNANAGFTSPFFSNAGYTNPHYTQTKYYTYTPNTNRYVPVAAAPAPTRYYTSSYAASSPAGHYARALPQEIPQHYSQGLLYPTYY